MQILPDPDDAVPVDVSDEFILLGGTPIVVRAYAPLRDGEEPEVFLGVGRADRAPADIASGSPSAARRLALAILRAADAADATGGA
jgi:hypothetical protein